ncbi:uncharacterized protein HMPREF1541_04715 [Cyphellophora europaea CBS 101466]|uniref:Guanine nucleotide-exchange factor SEC12 n=1 Tax=Cyphellophora europaea (strain CBS 101466) TaxID=1220924 RepID=W2RXF3_CYPE1|nr:uncharacterized protein HMPREF1541_04715 [Cyphellophora europaea CBS 101466]ETN40438.1 hypothetical protein HMPREF1541_04715 [Cyphellophora europaea CBS 101466]
MTPHVHEVRKKLSYPLYGGDFDPLNPDFLLVGGGGGESSTGVPNRISLIDTSRRDELNEIAEIELAKDEDSVTTLAVASSNEHALTAIAGINSSTIEQEAGRNEHLRSFRIGLPSRKRKADGSPAEKVETPRSPSSQALSKSALFRSANAPKNDTYQRVLRVCRTTSKNQARIAVIASGLAPENEVITFQPVSNAVTSTIDEISRISLGKSEAADADVTAVEDNGHCLAYCTDHAVYLQQLPRTKGSRIEEPVKVYEVSTPNRKPKFRAIRFITPDHILLLQNTFDRSGASLIILKLKPELSTGHIALRKSLARTTKSAVGLDTCPLSPNPAGEFQTVIAVSSQDSSIELLTLDYRPSSGIRRFTPYTYLPAVHQGPLTRIVFSTYLPLPSPITTAPPLQVIRLASVGVDQIVVVHTLPLRPDPTTSRTPRYVLTAPGASDTLQTALSTTVAILMITLVALLMQAFCEIRGAVPPTLHAADYLPSGLSAAIVKPYIGAHTPSNLPEAAAASVSSIVDAITDAPNTIPTTPSLSELREQLEALVAGASDTAGEAAQAGAIIVRDTGTEVAAELRHGADVVRDETVRRWEELSEREKHGWKERLKGAGHWVEEQGEKVLKGILFSQLAEVVGEAVRG